MTFKIVLAVAIIFLSSAATAQDNLPTIHRGDVPIYRGQIDISTKAGQKHGRQAFARAGDQLWLIDHKARHVTACELARTTQVGGRKIRCSKRRLSLN